MKCDFAGSPAQGNVVQVSNPQTSAMTDRAARLPTDDEVAAIHARHLVDTPLRPADLLFVSTPQ